MMLIIYCCLQTGVVRCCGRLLWRSSKPSKDQQGPAVAAPSAPPAPPAAPPTQFLSYPVAYPYASWGPPGMFPVYYAPGGPCTQGTQGQDQGAVQLVATTGQQAFQMPLQFSPATYNQVHYTPVSLEATQLQQYVRVGATEAQAFGMPPQSPPAAYAQQLLQRSLNLQDVQLQQRVHGATTGQQAFGMPPQMPTAAYAQQGLHTTSSLQDAQLQHSEYPASVQADSNLLLLPYARSGYGGH